jgi:chorismate-pyruvate lyase
MEDSSTRKGGESMHRDARVQSFSRIDAGRPSMDELDRTGRGSIAAARSLALGMLLLSGCALAPTAPTRDRLERTQILALIQTLNADLLSHDSATSTLERWCGTHRLADPARIVAQRVRGDVKPIPEELRTRLAVDAGEALAYRHVRLMCGDRVLSEADNWYVPSRLSAEMNQRLDNSDEPFGKVVRALGFQRRTLTADLLWSPLPPGWEMAESPPGHEALHVPKALLRHQAVLYTSAQVPFSAVIETYTNSLLDFGSWAARLDAGP